MKKLLTLCIIHQRRRILLGMKKRGFGAGKWNGFGGKVTSEETIEESMKREVQEEAGIAVIDFEKVGVIEFEFQGNPELLEVHVFRAGMFTGEPTESEEMQPQWFNIEAIPFEKMWADDKYWMPFLLGEKKFKGRFLFGDSDNILHQELSEVAEV